MLSAARRAGMSASALTMTDIDAYCRLSGIALSAWELETILLIDQAALSAANRKAT